MIINIINIIKREYYNNQITFKKAPFFRRKGAMEID